MKTALTIAGSDSSGGAGIQADLKTMTANGVFGMSAVTSITAQNTTGVSGIYDVSPEALTAQLDAVFTDIFPDSVKRGRVYAVDAFGTVEQSEEPSYDIMVEEDKCLYKHICESEILGKVIETGFDRPIT